MQEQSPWDSALAVIITWILQFLVCSPTAVEVSYPYRCWCLTHTGVGVSPIQVSVSHPYTQWGLTHRTFRKSGRRLFPLYIISQDSLSSSPLTLARIHHCLALAISASSLSSSPLTLARIHHSLTLVIFALSHSSSPLRPFRHLLVLPSVISQLCSEFMPWCSMCWLLLLMRNQVEAPSPPFE